MDYSSEILKIVEGALKSDKIKVSNYTKLLIDKLKENNDNYLKILATKEDISILKDGVKAGIART